MTCLCQQIAGNDIELSPACIGNLWIFQGLAPENVQALAKEALRKKMKKGENVFIQGDTANELFLIKGGRIKLTKVLEDGTQLMLDLRKAGDFVGEICSLKKGNIRLVRSALKIR